MAQLEHLFLEGFVEDRPFKSNLSVRGTESPQRNRGDHGNRLLNQLQALQLNLEYLAGERAARGLDTAAGITIAIQFSPDADYDFKKLEWSREGIEVLSVVDGGNGPVVALYVPDGRLGALEKRVHEYLRTADDRDTSAVNMLREIMDRAGVGLVLLADHRLSRIDQIDRALADRVSVSLSLSHFQDDGAWSAFLRGLAQHVRTPSLQILTESAIRTATHVATGGNRRATMRLLIESVLIAVDAGADAVTLAHLRLAFERTHGSTKEVPNPYGSA